MFTTRKQGAVMAAIFVVLSIAALVVASHAKAASFESPQFTPASYWISPIQISTNTGFYVNFDVYMASTTANPTMSAVALEFQSCNGAPLRLQNRTRHLANGETLETTKGGPGGATGMEWTRPMGVPVAGHAVKLHLSFIGVQPGYFCLNIWDASGDGDYLTIDLGMK